MSIFKLIVAILFSLSLLGVLTGSRSTMTIITMVITSVYLAYTK